jgi:hypothetical protein
VAQEATADSQVAAEAAVVQRKPEPHRGPEEQAERASQSSPRFFKMDESPIDDWVILDGESIENMIRWNGSTQTWPLPEGRIAIKRNEFDFSNTTQQSEPT